MVLFWDSGFQRDISPFAFARNYIVNSSLPLSPWTVSFGVGCNAVVKQVLCLCRMHEESFSVLTESCDVSCFNIDYTGLTLVCVLIDTQISDGAFSESGESWEEKWFLAYSCSDVSDPIVLECAPHFTGCCPPALCGKTVSTSLASPRQASGPVGMRH